MKQVLDREGFQEKIPPKIQMHSHKVGYWIDKGSYVCNNVKMQTTIHRIFKNVDNLSQ